jgi:hypothetical protein
MLFRVVPLSLGTSVLLLALIGSWLNTVGWRVSGHLFLDDVRVTTGVLQNSRRQLEEWPGASAHEVENLGVFAGPSVALASLKRLAMLPLTLVASAPRRIEVCAYVVFGLMSSMLIWSVFGSAIARMTMLRVGRGHRCGPLEAVSYCGRRCLSMWGAPLLPLTGVALIAAITAVVGALMRVTVLAGPVAVGWGGLLILGLLNSLLLVGIGIGWPLMWCCVAAEKDGDAFDALSSAFAYVYQQFVRLIVYVVLAVCIGWVGSQILAFFVSLTLDTTQLFVGWGIGSEFRSDNFQQNSVQSTAIQVWNQLWYSLSSAYPYAAFWTSASIIYLLRRREIDQTDFDQVHSSEDDDPLPLPSLDTDSQGVPKVAANDAEQADTSAENE